MVQRIVSRDSTPPPAPCQIAAITPARRRYSRANLPTPDERSRPRAPAPMQPRKPTTRSDCCAQTLAQPTPPIPSHNSGDGSGSVVINALPLPIDCNAFGADGEPAKPVTLEVIPAPGANGVLPARDGRRQRVADVSKLAAALNAQSFVARIDFDHRSEPSAPTFAGTTEAEGWLSNYRLNHRGGIDADIEFGASALESGLSPRWGGTPVRFSPRMTSATLRSSAGIS